MDSLELTHMRKTLNSNPVVLQKDAVWINAFNEYNKSNRPVSMGCKPCYFKVLQFHLNAPTQ